MLYWIPALVWMGVIFYLSGRTGAELQSFFPFIEDFNPGHVGAYFLLTLFYFAALSKNGHRLPYRKTIALCLIYGITDEVHQYFVPTRHPDIIDLARDMLGAGLALGTVYLVEIRKRKRHPDAER